MSATISPPRRKIVWIVALAVVFAVIGWVVPRVYIGFAKLIPAEDSITYRTMPTDTTVVDYEALQAGTPRDPECNTLNCFVHTTEGYVEHKLNTSPDEKRLQANLSATVNIHAGEQEFSAVDESVIARDSGYFAPLTTAQTTLHLPADTTVTNQPVQRSGLQFIFPFQAKKHSYAGFNLAAGVSNPMDFVDETEVGNHDALEYHQLISPEPLLGYNTSVDGQERLLPVVPARFMYSPQELEATGTAPQSSIEPTAYYAAERTFFVEPRTGILLDMHEHHYVFAALSSEEAQEMADDLFDTGTPHPQRTLFHQQTIFDEATLAQQQERADGPVAILRMFQILAWIAKAITFLLIAVIVFYIASYRRALHTS